MWHMNDVGWGWWLVMSVGMIAFWGLLIYGLVLLVRSAGSQSSQSSLPTPAPQPPARSETPKQVLERRLASGEIDAGEYERVRGVLDHEAAPPAPETAPR